MEKKENIIKQLIKGFNYLNEALLLKNGNKLYRLNSFNIFIVNESDENLIVKFGNLLSFQYIEADYYEKINNRGKYMYDLGIVIWEVLTQKIPFKRNKDVEVDENLNNTKLSIDLPKETPQYLIELLCILLRKDLILKEENEKEFFRKIMDEEIKFIEDDYIKSYNTFQSCNNYFSYMKIKNDDLSREQIIESFDESKRFEHLIQILGCYYNNESKECFIYTEPLGKNVATYLTSNEFLEESDTELKKKIYYDIFLNIFLGIEELSNDKNLYLNKLLLEHIYFNYDSDNDKVVSLKIVNYGQNINVVNKIFGQETSDGILNEFCRLLLKSNPDCPEDDEIGNYLSSLGKNEQNLLAISYKQIIPESSVNSFRSEKDIKNDIKNYLEILSGNKMN